MRQGNLLGEFLRARRDLVQPEAVGLPRGDRRRVSGLRREEVALLAGVSGDYYLRLEQGKDRHPSPSILDALARTLQLDAATTAYLHRLGAADAAQRSAAADAEVLPLGIEQLLQTLRTPAFVQNRCMDVLAANGLARMISPNFTAGTNLLRAAFLDSADSRLYRDWDQVAEDVVASIRPLAGPELEGPRMAALIEELSDGSETFRHLWARHDVRPKVGGIRQLQHPTLGRIELRHEKLEIAGAGGQMLVIYHAEPGSPSAAALAALADEASASPGRSRDGRLGSDRPGDRPRP